MNKTIPFSTLWRFLIYGGLGVINLAAWDAVALGMTMIIIGALEIMIQNAP